MKNIFKSQERNINIRYKEGPNEILKLKNTMTDMKNSLDWLNGKQEMTEERISEFKTRQWTLSLNNQEKRLKNN